MLALTKIRLEQGMSMNQLAIAANIDCHTIYAHEADNGHTVYPKTAKKIVDALGVGLWDVYKCVQDRRLVCKEVE